LGAKLGHKTPPNQPKKLPVRHKPHVIAAITTVLFAGTLGVLIAVTGFGVIRIVEDMAEGVGILPLRWGENHVAELLQIAGGLSIPVVAWFSVWFYRQALNAERILTAHEEKLHAATK
jgi:hypothetical protein